MHLCAPQPVTNSRPFHWDEPPLDPTSAPRHLLFGLDVTAAMRDMLRGMGRPVDPKLMMRLQAGHRVLHVTSRRSGTIVRDPFGSSSPNTSAIRWDGDLVEEEVEHRDFTVLYPGHPADV